MLCLQFCASLLLLYPHKWALFSSTPLNLLLVRSHVSFPLLKARTIVRSYLSWIQLNILFPWTQLRNDHFMLDPLTPHYIDCATPQWTKPPLYFSRMTAGTSYLASFFPFKSYFQSTHHKCR